MVRDTKGNVLQHGGRVTAIQDLKVGVKAKIIRLIEGDHDINCKIGGIRAKRLNRGLWAGLKCMLLSSSA